MAATQREFIKTPSIFPDTSMPGTMYDTTKNTTPSGFMEFKPRDRLTQAKYDAMSPGWEGEKSSTASIARGDYDLDKAETERTDLRSKKAVPKVAKPEPAPSNCSIQ